ncbi:MAG: EF-P beta-lysylation protein EpmB [gamma proteobacterium symbiont of Bathyaustriella thionipta]|nr:EF-P beta-lysylation protein EpmB [gamma proteobacterium symbiont of Bathyaustriella thionipta]MCU7951437.1 EF-P beta-lysylation protein EpmB [gamma proteobacterium symbiont of Bathyaustriella thionipta]MCU7957995.1 EF-P beta-lysylation protein EpmB [gamma proteobacterium symbiont of Bathyaustriella thionipta]MCU7968838.1 EF-P beta-lysylation protein EpmB [gamma proteobacterium symbiont of Bathyaustriella thionipta]
MIPRNKTGNQTITYFTDPLKLIEQLQLTPEQMQFSTEAVQNFRFKVPAAYVDKIQTGTPSDPLLRQIFPVQQEIESVKGYTKDPLKEADSLSQPGLLQKYHGRALLLVTSSCAINCRYCFRRHYPYEEKGHFWKQIEQNIELIKQDLSLSEVILSGGDPLSLSDSRFAELILMLDNIPHLKRLRIHTRFPVVKPERISDNFLKILAASRLRIVMVLHINHAQEIGLDNTQSLLKLHKQQITLLNQSVLLKGVNDNADTLAALSETLIDNHIIPYYLHMLDKIQGSAHFEVNSCDAHAIYQQLRARLSGYMLPRLVREIPGEKSKTSIIVK